MTVGRRILIVAIAALVVVSMGGGIAAGATLARQQEVAAEQAALYTQSTEQPVEERDEQRVEQPVEQPSEQTTADTAQVVKATTHSVTGQVVSVHGERLTVRDRTRRLHAVQITNATALRKQGRQINRDTLAPGARLMVVGSPDANGVVVARLIAVEASPARRPAPRETPRPDIRDRPFAPPKPRS